MNLLGDIYLNEGQLDLAAGAYVRAIDLDPSQAPAKSLRAAELLGAQGAVAAGRHRRQRGSARRSLPA